MANNPEDPEVKINNEKLDEPPAPDMGAYFEAQEAAAANAAQEILEGREPAKQFVMSQIEEGLRGIMGSAKEADKILRECEQAIVESRCPAEGFGNYQVRTGQPHSVGEYERTKEAVSIYFQQITEVIQHYTNLKNALREAIYKLPVEQRGAFGMLSVAINLAVEKIGAAHKSEDLPKEDYALRLGRICSAISQGERKIVNALKDMGLDLPKIN